MKLETMIQYMFDNFPLIFKDRRDCLDHLFCTIGNGLYWVDGQLVDPYVDPSIESELECRLVGGKAHQYNKLSIRGEYTYINQLSVKEELRTLRERYILSLPDNKYYTRPRRMRWTMFICGFSTLYAYMFNFPEDIQPDWMAGIEECKALMMMDGYDPDFPERPDVEQREKNLQEAIALRKANPRVYFDDE